MERLLTLTAACVLTALTIQAQPVIQWQNSFGGSLSDVLDQGNGVVNNLINTSDGGSAFAGTSFSNDGDVSGHQGLPAKSDIWVSKLDSLGNLEWQKSLGGTESEKAYGIKQTTDGGYIVIGETKSNDGDVSGFQGATDVWVVKLDDQGNIQWQNSFGGTALDIGSDIFETADSSFIFSADTWSTDGDITLNQGSIDWWLVKLDQSGVIQWQKTFGGSGAERVRSIKATPDGGVVGIGTTTSIDGDVTLNPFPGFVSVIWVVKIDSLGDKEWDQCYGGSFIDNGNDIEPTVDGGYIMSGTSSSSDGNLTCNHGGSDAWMSKLDATGNIIWWRCYGGAGTEYGKSVRQTADNGFLLACTADSANGDVSSIIGESDLWIIKTDSMGNIEWEQTYGGTLFEGITTALPTPDGGYLLGAQSGSNDVDVSGHHGALSEYDIWIVKLAPYTTGINESPGNISSFSVSPNPVTDVAYMKFELSEKSHVLIELMDISGRVVYKLSNKNMPAGIHEQELNLQNLSLEQGMYLLRTNTGNSTNTLKLIKN